MQPCPLMLTQAMVDRGRFMSDEECNPKNGDGCDRYHKGAFQCLLMVNPRSVILNFSLVEPYWQTTQWKCSEISKSSFLTAVLKKPRCATNKGTLKQEREANQCKVETRKITLSRFH